VTREEIERAAYREGFADAHADLFERESARFVVERVQASALVVGDRILASGAIHTLREIGHPPALASTPLDFKTDDGEWRGWATDWVFCVVDSASDARANGRNSTMDDWMFRFVYLVCFLAIVFVIYEGVR